jgi:hypothetical protein
MPCATVRSSSMASSIFDAKALEHLPLLRSVDLLAGEREVDSQRHEALLRAVVQVALDAPPLGVAGLQDSRPRGAQLALEVTVLDRQERRPGGCGHQLGILGQGLVDHHRRHRVAAPIDRHPGAARAGGRARELLAVGL